MYNRTSLNRRGKTWQGTAGFCRFLNLEYGYSIPETCKKVQEKVKTAIEAAAEALGDDGRILVRESGTEPLIRVMVEAGTDDLCHKYVDSVVDVMEAEGLVVE